jgi:serine/threonine-protein kinase
VLFEMLAGLPAFRGEDLSEIFASTIKGDVNFGLLPANLHPRVREAVTRCLQKDLKRRYQDIGDVRYEIEQALADPSGVLMQPLATTEPPTKLRMMLGWLAAAVVLIAIIAGAAVWYLKPAPPAEPHQVTRFSYELPNDQQFDNFLDRALAISPDGRQLVYTTNRGLYVRSMNDLDARLIPGTAGAQQPFFSPDSKWIGYCSAAENKLKKIAISGGIPIPITDAIPAGFLSWGADDTIVFCHANQIMRVSAGGGIAKPAVKTAGNVFLVDPQILPDGKSVLYTRALPLPRKIMMQSLESGESKELFDGQGAQYLPTGHVVYAVENNLFVRTLDLNPPSAGEANSIIEGVLGSGDRQYAVSDSGTLIYMPDTNIGATGLQRALVWVNRDGKEESITAKAGDFGDPRISPDGTEVAFTTWISGNADIYIWDLALKSMRRLTFNKDMDAFPLWSHDGKRIAFLSDRDGYYGIYWKAANGTGKDEPLGSAPAGRAFAPVSWSKDGNTLITINAPLTMPLNLDIAALSMEGNHAVKPLLQEKHNEFQPRISPDGRWMVYTSDESGGNEVFVRPFPEVDNGKWQISVNGGDSPLWSRDGRELFYRNGDAVMCVPVKTEPNFSRGTPRILFQGKYISAATKLQDLQLSPWDVSGDGRFVMIKESGSTASPAASPRKINVVLNWFEELKQRVPKK